MRKGIHRGYKKDQDQAPRRAWVADDPMKDGEWVSEVEYRAADYSPDFDSLPVLVVERLWEGPLDIDAAPVSDKEKEYIRQKVNDV